MIDMERELQRLREKKSALESAERVKRLQGKTFESILLEMQRDGGLFAPKEKISENVLLFA